MVWWCHLNKNILTFLSVVLSYTFALANSYVADTSVDYETEIAPPPPDDQFLPTLTQIIRNSYRFPDSIEGSEGYSPAPEMRESMSKRTRYYRKYPGKRQNRHYSELYDCNPSSAETIRLLHAIHQARLGDIDHIVFCNRLRNPNRIIPNPRYVGKRNWNN